jgi:hypothetical protein
LKAGRVTEEHVWFYSTSSWLSSTFKTSKLLFQVFIFISPGKNWPLD